MDGKISEQRVCCKIQAQLGFPPTEIHADLQKVYGNGALKYGTVCKWVLCLNDGPQSIENDPRVGRSVSVLTEKNVATVKTLTEEDTCYTMQEIQELSGIHLSSVLRILHEQLGLCKICARWVPHLLTDEQKQSQVRLALHVIEKYDKSHRLEEIVTGDETWIHHFQPDSKAENKVWVSSEGNRPVIEHCCKTSNRMLYAIFCDRKVQSFKFQSRKVVLSLESFTEKVFLLNLLISIRNTDRTPVSAASNYSMIMHRAHKYATVQVYLKESGLDVLDHPPCSPDLFPCDFWLFPRLKEMLARQCFESRRGKGSAVYQCMQHIPKEDYRAAFRKWVDRCKM